MVEWQSDRKVGHRINTILINMNSFVVYVIRCPLIYIFLFNELCSKVENLFYESRIRVNGKKILKKSTRVSYRYIQCRTFCR